MSYIIDRRKYKPNKAFLKHFVDYYWFIPPDVLQRGIESNIWSLVDFKRPSLEIGVGDGKLTKHIFSRVKKIDVGIDNEPAGHVLSSKNKLYLNTLIANAEKMPFKNSTFNTVFANSTFEHIENDFEAISEASRVLKRGGFFYMTVPNSNLKKWIYEYEKSRSDSGTAKRKTKEFDKRADHFHYRKLSEWIDIFKKNDMEVVFYKYYFSKQTAIFWYKIFRFFTYKINKTELWSLLSDSRYANFVPQRLFKTVISKVLERYYDKGFFTEDDKGAQLFIIAKKIK